MKDVGYSYVNIDDCWTTKERDSNGNLVPDPDKWPRGIKPVVDELHAQGLKFGLYGCAGSLTCASYPGSEGHELQDMEQLAEWDVDFWKHDNCFTECPETPYPQTCWDYPVSTEPWYAKMGDAIQQVKPQKEILFNLCQWGRNDVWEWGDKYGHSWRIADDNWGNWESVIRIGARANDIAQYAGPGGFNDLDMLVSFKLLLHKSRNFFLCVIYTDFSFSSSAMRSSPRPKSVFTSDYGLLQSHHS